MSSDPPEAIWNLTQKLDVLEADTLKLRSVGGLHGTHVRAFEKVSLPSYKVAHAKLQERRKEQQPTDSRPLLDSLKTVIAEIDNTQAHLKSILSHTGNLEQLEKLSDAEQTAALKSHAQRALVAAFPEADKDKAEQLFRDIDSKAFQADAISESRDAARAVASEVRGLSQSLQTLVTYYDDKAEKFECGQRVYLIGAFLALGVGVTTAVLVATCWARGLADKEALIYVYHSLVAMPVAAGILLFYVLTKRGTAALHSAFEFRHRESAAKVFEYMVSRKDPGLVEQEHAKAIVNALITVPDSPYLKRTQPTESLPIEKLTELLDLMKKLPQK